MLCIAAIHACKAPLLLSKGYASLQSQSYTNYFADALTAEARRDSRIVGIHAAMGGGTGMNRFEKVRSQLGTCSAFSVTGQQLCCLCLCKSLCNANPDFALVLCIP